MNDFDFEELDKAVNELANKNHEEHGESEPIAALVPKPDPGVKPPVSEPIAVPVPESKLAPKPIESAQQSEPVAVPQKRTRLSDTRPRSRGAFMDIVPPASRKSGTRVGVALQPVSKPEDVVPEAPQHKKEAEKQPEPKTPKLTSQPEITKQEPEASKSAPVPEKPDDDISWPDPLDFHDDEPKRDAQPTDGTDGASPFLTEAKVEKRPLGAFSNFRTEESKPIETESPSTPVVDELTPDKEGVFEEPKETPKSAEKPHEPKEAEPEPAPEKKVSAKPDLHSTAMMSIPQQYRTQSMPADTATRPVFDTKEYHPPLLTAAVPGHRGGGSMWGKLFIALVVLALLGAAAYFTYIYVIQR